jgi:hypothetical protein
VSNKLKPRWVSAFPVKDHCPGESIRIHVSPNAKILNFAPISPDSPSYVNGYRYLVWVLMSEDKNLMSRHLYFAEGDAKIPPVYALYVNTIVKEGHIAVHLFELQGSPTDEC